MGSRRLKITFFNITQSNVNLNTSHSKENNLKVIVYFPLVGSMHSELFVLYILFSQALHFKVSNAKSDLALKTSVAPCGIFHVDLQ